MSKIDKLVKKILLGHQVSYEEAQALLYSLGFAMKCEGSHCVFRKKGYGKNISLKKRSQLLPYQIKDVKEVLKEYGYPKEKE